ILIKQGVYDLWQSAPVPEWQSANDPRAKIRIADILHMSSGLRIKAPQDPDYDPAGTYSDHVYLYTGGVDSYHYAATRPQQWPPNTIGRYRNSDPVLISYLGARPDRRRDRAFVVRVAASGGLCEGEQLQEVVGGADHGPLGTHFFDTPQQELAEA